MGRGRGKGKKLTVIASREDPGSGGEEIIPTYRRRGRPQKPLKDEIDEDAADKIEEQVGEDVKHTAPNKDLKVPTAENGKKRRRYTQAKENSDSALEDNVALKPDNDDSTRSIGFRRNGNRRKSKPHRAAEAGVECK